ncbi:MAG: Uma2 family endonuclease [Symploca sp. SIO2G7]|nr:Uma2 family endonuclease [Symploca sp. SIO2G7]
MMQTLVQHYTLEEYRSLEETAQERHEYHNGEVLAMTGGTLEHSAISGNIHALLKSALRKTRFKPFNSDLRIWIPQHCRGVYPDVMVIEGEPKFHENRRDEVVNPQLIVEVLSRSTEAHDRGNKFMYYRSIPEFSEYLLVNQYQPVVDQYVRTDKNEWLMRSHEGLDGIINLETIGLELNTGDIYEDIVFASAANGEDS